ncbi:Ig-like domain-containing protein [Bifidobacterium imperatoris]|uniref:Concanavalin A-like lectin/glucanases superfamily n=1 Tax=Bifidobacterium imperatoris TaxID=2020965 RepID=A0A2N5IT98_9BIFI|nr:LamG-like jellyroll fold domain-containing protein [Bifidobacterium imperatoris]PLS25184.1 Concanavalin A-like lectin/glucanases superfamily [Bifidobacterium imperatoris]QSY57704.1 Ig-like domain-containing protein [Bifidobacterium imperatoris]
MGYWKKAVGSGLAVATLFAGLIVPMTAQAEESQPNESAPSQTAQAKAAKTTTDAKVPEPVVDYTFDDVKAGAATVANSGSGAADYNGSVVNADELKAGTRGGKATLQLPAAAKGADQAKQPYIKIPNGIYKNAKGVTVSTWINWDGNANDNAPWTFIIGGDKLSNNNRGVFFSPTESGKLTVVANDGGEYKANHTAALTANVWTHMTITEDGNTLAVYLNGQKVDEQASTIDFMKLHNDASTYSGLIGRTQWTEQFASYFGGQLDDFQVWNSALNADQVAAAYDEVAPKVTRLDQSEWNIETMSGTTPALPATVGAKSDDGTYSATITWNAIDPKSYERGGKFDVKGTAAGKEVVAHVTVIGTGDATADLSKSTGAFMGGAAGTLYGVYDENLPSNNLVDGINLRTVSTKAQDGPQHPGADALEVAKNVTDSSNGKTFIYMTDIWRGFPYQWRSDSEATDPAYKAAVGDTSTYADDKYDDESCKAVIDNYTTKLVAEAKQVATLDVKYQKNIVFAPYNEPNGNMFTGEYKPSWNLNLPDTSCNKKSMLDDPTMFYYAWDTAYAALRKNAPNALIGGPNFSELFPDNMKAFLEHAAQSDTMPDYNMWHELSEPSLINANVPKYRKLEAEAFAGTKYEGKQLPINLSEYAYNYHTSVPGQMIQWVSALEQQKVDGDIAYWNMDGNLSDSAVESNRGNGQWWLLKEYSEMTGDTVELHVPSSDSYTLQGVATLDTSKKQAKAIIGGTNGAGTFTFAHVPSDVFGDTALVTVKKIGWSGTIGDNAGPDVIAQFTTKISSDGSVAVDFGTDALQKMNADDAYVITLEPGTNASVTAQSRVTWKKTYEAENAEAGGQAQVYPAGSFGKPSAVSAFFASGQDASGNSIPGGAVANFYAGSTSTLTFNIDAPETGTYDLSVFNGAYNGTDYNPSGPASFFVTVNGGFEQELHSRLVYKWWVWDHTDTTVKLNKGSNTIVLSSTSLDGKSMNGTMAFDKIDLSLPSETAGTRVYEAEDSRLTSGATVDYSGKSGVAQLGADQSATFWVYAKNAGTHAITVNAFGKYQVSVNGNDVGKQTKFDATLEGGINKIVVTGGDVDSITVAGNDDKALQSTTYQAEDAKIAGSAKAEDLSLADGGKAVTGIGGKEEGNGNTLTFDKVKVDADGTYALTFRYSNEEQIAATHYNPDVIARNMYIKVNGKLVKTMTLPCTFNKNNFFEATTYVPLKAGENSIELSGYERLSFGDVQADGSLKKVSLNDRWAAYGIPNVRSQYAPNIDYMKVAKAASVKVEEPDNSGDNGQQKPGDNEQNSGTDQGQNQNGNQQKPEGNKGQGNKLDKPLSNTGSAVGIVAGVGLLLVVAAGVMLMVRRRKE